MGSRTKNGENFANLIPVGFCTWIKRQLRCPQEGQLLFKKFFFTPTLSRIGASPLTPPAPVTTDPFFPHLQEWAGATVLAHAPGEKVSVSDAPRIADVFKHSFAEAPEQ